MVIQCIARKSQHLLLSLLEVHTLIYIICAFAIYAFWLKKPLDVQDPTILDFEQYGELLALMTMSSPGLTSPATGARGQSEAELLRHQQVTLDRPPSDLSITRASPYIGQLTTTRDRSQTFVLQHDEFDAETGFSPNFGPRVHRGDATLTMNLLP